MSARTQQIAERLFDFMKAEAQGERAARAAGPLLEEDGLTPTPEGADLFMAMGMTYALLSLDYFKGDFQASLECFGVALQSAVTDPRVRDRVRFLRMPTPTGKPS